MHTRSYPPPHALVHSYPLTLVRPLICTPMLVRTPCSPCTCSRNPRLVLIRATPSPPPGSLPFIAVAVRRPYPHAHLYPHAPLLPARVTLASCLFVQTNPPGSLPFIAVCRPCQPVGSWAWAFPVLPSPVCACIKYIFSLQLRISLLTFT